MKQPDSLWGLLVMARDRAGMRQCDAARALGTASAYLCRIEGGYQAPSADLLDRMIALYGADADSVYRAAGRIPEDVRQILMRDRDGFRYVRNALGGRKQ